MEVNPARAATGASISAATTAAFVNMLRVFTIHGTSIGDIISNFSTADEMDDPLEFAFAFAAKFCKDYRLQSVRVSRE